MGFKIILLSLAFVGLSALSIDFEKYEAYSKTAQNSYLLTKEDLPKLKKYFNGSDFYLTRVNAVHNGSCDFIKWHKALMGIPNILVVAKANSGFVFGGFRNISCAGVEPGHYHPSNGFVFSLNYDYRFYN